MPTNIENVTADQLRDLRRRADEAGDAEMVETCDKALEKWPRRSGELRKCVRVIASASYP